MKAYYPSLILMAAGVLAVSGCSDSKDPSILTDSDSSSPSNNDDGQISRLLDSIGSFSGLQRIGWMQISDNIQSQQVSAFGTFFDIDRLNPQDNIIASILSNGGDTCVVEPFLPESPLLEDQLLNDFMSVSAGEVLTLGSAEGSYAELERLDIQDGIGYLSFDQLSYPSPNSLLVSIPGDVFSASSLTIQKPSAIENMTLVVDSDVPMGTSFQWAPAVNNDTIITVTLFGAEESEFSVECFLVDDGDFTMPASVYTQADTLIDGDSRLVFESASRVRALASRVGSDMFITVRSISGN